MSRPTPKQPDAPASLKALQEAFGQAMATPFRFTDNTGAFETQIEAYPTAITDLIRPRPDKGLSPARRLATYNSQYWFRLFSILQKELPLLRHLLGTADLNKLVSAYLTRFPPDQYDLRLLTQHLNTFLAEDATYGLPVLQQAARLDCLFIAAFDAPFVETLDTEDLNGAGEGVAEITFTFQPHWFLFEEDFPLVAGRRLAAQDEGDGLELDVAPTKGYWAVYRNVDGVQTEPLGPLQYYIMDLLSEGATLHQAMTAMTEVLDEDALAFLAENLQHWFAAWTAMGWICKKR